MESIKMELMPEAAFETDNKDKAGDGEFKIPEPRCGRRSGISLAEQRISQHMPDKPGGKSLLEPKKRNFQLGKSHKA